MNIQRTPIDAAVLNTIQAAHADLALSAGLLSCTGLGNAIKVSDRLEVTKTAHAAGTAPVKRADMGGITLAAGKAYAITVSLPNRIVYGGPEPDPLYFTRTYKFFSGTSAPTAAAVATQFVALINADANFPVTGSVTSTDGVTVTSDDVANGDIFFTVYPEGTVLSITTPYVAPAGTNDIVNAFAPGSGTADDYTTWKITWNKLYPDPITGKKSFVEVDTYIFASAGATNFAAFETELDAILDGTHTPVADYL